MSYSLKWNHDKGCGFDNTPCIDYGVTYFNDYIQRDSTLIGEKLIESRFNLVRKFYAGNDLIDVGIGGGGFIKRIDCMGTDINPCAVGWLREHGKLSSLDEEHDAACFWDSLEHFSSPWIALRNVKKFVFISMPIYESKEHCLKSKHYKPGEHIWYFTSSGLISFMLSNGFDFLHMNDDETKIGREDIKSFVFKRFEE